MALSHTRIRARSYELDSFGHLNHAVFLNHWEHARWDALAAGGLDIRKLEKRGEAVHVVRIEADYRREVRMGQELEIATSAEEARNSSFVLRQVTRDPNEPETVFAEARVHLVWIGPDRRPMRIPDDVRTALGLGG